MIFLDDVRGGTLDYYGRCGRFWLSRCATKHLQRPSPELTPFQRVQFRTCITYAIRVLDWPLDLSPFQKDSLRYMPESAAVMISYCCMFIIASCQTFGSSMPELYAILDKVEAAAQLMLSMAPDIEHYTHVQGLLILKITTSLRKPSGGADVAVQRNSRQPEKSTSLGLANHEAVSGIGSSVGRVGTPTIDRIWDFSMFTSTS